ncbi:hypothetical protein GKO32_09400 [Amycolatopsis sp. RM579]|uniref:ARB-07466-like C-terminal domain-containing protein n=2 Tax=Amycolatopsis pithecellobii TaxID=664692 RepID=A0A6N7YQL4_9PSEU|nr:hypothetical protein [Amycolatopsis pithecellobii]
MGFTIWITSGPLGRQGPGLAAELKAPAPMSVPAPVTSSSTTPPSTTTPTQPSTTSKKPSLTTKPSATPPRATTQTLPVTREPAAMTTIAGRPCSSVLAGTQPQVTQAGNYLKAMFGVDTIFGRAARGGESDHPNGLALDFMVDTATGNKLADYVLANQSRLGVKYVIWRQRYNDGNGWSMLEDRGSPTANHYDHVHISFIAGAKASVTC